MTASGESVSEVWPIREKAVKGIPEHLEPVRMLWMAGRLHQTDQLGKYVRIFYLGLLTQH